MIMATLAFLLFSCDQGPKPQGPYIPVKGSAWHILVHDVDEYAGNELVYATWDGYLRCQDMAGRMLWEYDLESFPFDLKSIDLDLDGTMEFLVPTASGTLHAVSSTGMNLWSFQSELPLFAVAAGDIAGAKGNEVVCGGIDRYVYLLDAGGKQISKYGKVERVVSRLGVDDFDREEGDEVLIVANKAEATLAKFTEGSWGIVWEKTIKPPGEEFRNWENPSNVFCPYSLDIVDLDGDGFPEIIMGDTYRNRQSVMVTDRECNPLWISDRLDFFGHNDGTYNEFYSTAFVKAGDVDRSVPGKEVVSAAGGMIRIFSMDGLKLHEANSKLGFSDVFIKGREIFLGSAPNGDRHVYRLSYDEDIRDRVLALDWQGKIRNIENNIEQIRRQAMAYQPGDRQPRSNVWIRLRIRIDDTKESYEEYRSFLTWFQERFPYDNLKPYITMKVIEPEPPLDERGEPWFRWRWELDAMGGTQTVDEIVERARWIEENKIPTLFNVGHSCTPFVTLETAEKILQAAPEYCLGFVTSEDEQIELIPRYFKYYFGPLADLCVKYGYKKCVTMNKNLWWMDVPAIKEVYSSLFSGERKKVIGMTTDDANSRCPEMNLLGRAGLMLAGLVKDNEVSVQADHFSFNRFHQWENPRIGHPHLRRMVAHSTTGMTMFHARLFEVYKEDGSYTFSALGKECSEIFYHMIGKGLVFTPVPEDFMGYSPIGFAVHEPSPKWLVDAHNGHRPELWEDDPELHNAVIPHNGCLWGMTETPGHALQHVLMNKKRQFGYHVPAAPYGLPVFVPVHADLASIPGIDEWWHTDGIYIWREGGRKLTGTEAADSLRRSFGKAAGKLPFRLEGHAFMQVLRAGEGKYRLYLVDPGWLDPADRKVVVHFQMEPGLQAMDLLSGEGLHVENGRLELTVPAGVFSIIETYRQ